MDVVSDDSQLALLDFYLSERGSSRGGQFVERRLRPVHPSDQLISSVTPVTHLKKRIFHLK